MPTNGVLPRCAAIAAHPESAEKSIMTMHAKASAEKPILVPGSNVWRVAHAERASLIIDAADYFSAARAAMLAAEKRIMLIGWDFDARIRLGSPKDGSRAPATVGSFILWLVKHRPDLEVYVLRWNFGAVKSLFRGTTPLTIAKWALHDRIHFRLDSAHPLGASHHQKIVVVDDCLAFCGGIDMTRGRWDTRQHLDDDPGRIGPDRKSYGPWHDANMAIEGPIAAALGELARERWQCAGGEALSAVERKGSCWPDNLKIQFKKVDIGISRTRPKYGDNDEAHEIEALYLDLIAGARRHIYAESQYFASRKIAEAIARRLAEPDGPEIVLLNPEKADGWLEQEAMDTARARLFEALKRGDKRGRFRLYHPFTEADLRACQDHDRRRRNPAGRFLQLQQPILAAGHRMRSHSRCHPPRQQGRLLHNSRSAEWAARRASWRRSGADRPRHPGNRFADPDDRALSRQRPVAQALQGAGRRRDREISCRPRGSRPGRAGRDVRADRRTRPLPQASQAASVDARQILN
jgi:phosphatidylserine/phosphatidylglycerophosphate/cardiolipin synthase-like enzyme